MQSDTGASSHDKGSLWHLVLVTFQPNNNVLSYLYVQNSKIKATTTNSDNSCNIITTNHVIVTHLGNMFNGCQRHTPIHFYIKHRVSLTEELNLWHHVSHELLSAKTWVNCHHQSHVN